MAALAAVLALLGVSWGFGLVSGTATLTAAMPLAIRASPQGLVDAASRFGCPTVGMTSAMVVASVVLLRFVLPPAAWCPAARRRAHTTAGGQDAPRR